MLVALTEAADATAVKQELIARGLWIAATLRDPTGREVTYRIAPYSGHIDAREIESIAGVRTVLLPAPEHPRMDAQGRASRSPGCVSVGRAGLYVRAMQCRIADADRTDCGARGGAGARFLRGGAFKPRSSPYSFQGHGETALDWLRAAADRHGLRVVTEVLSEHDVERVAAMTDLVQIGSRNMQNFALLKRVGGTISPCC